MLTCKWYDSGNKGRGELILTQHGELLWVLALNA